MPCLYHTRGTWQWLTWAVSSHSPPPAGWALSYCLWIPTYLAWSWHLVKTRLIDYWRDWGENSGSQGWTPWGWLKSDWFEIEWEGGWQGGRGQALGFKAVVWQAQVRWGEPVSSPSGTGRASHCQEQQGHPSHKPLLPQGCPPTRGRFLWRPSRKRTDWVP